MPENTVTDFIVLDGCSGTYFGLESACLINTRWLNDQELELLQEGSDSDRALLAESHGQLISALLNSQE